MQGDRFDYYREVHFCTQLMLYINVPGRKAAHGKKIYEVFPSITPNGSSGASLKGELPN